MCISITVNTQHLSELADVLCAIDEEQSRAGDKNAIRALVSQAHETLAKALGAHEVLIYGQTTMINWKPHTAQEPLTRWDILCSALVLILPICILLLGA